MKFKMMKLFFAFVFIAISVFMLTRKWRQVEFCPSPDETTGTIVVWNKTDQDIDIALKQYRHKVQSVPIGKTVRGCITVFSKGKGNYDPDPVGYIMVTYGGKKYRFTESDILNAFPDQEKEKSNASKITTRHFVLLTITAGVGEWENIKKHVEKDDKQLDEKVSYLVLSNYYKLGDFWSEEARLSLIKIK